jgi:hypothetical protein
VSCLAERAVKRTNEMALNREFESRMARTNGVCQLSGDCGGSATKLTVERAV